MAFRPKKLPIPESFDPLEGASDSELLQAICKRFLDGEKPAGAVIAMIGMNGAQKFSRIGDRTLALGLTQMLNAALMAPVKFDCPEDHDGETS